MSVTHPSKGIASPLVHHVVRLFDFGVPMFFVLSGFVIAYALRDATVTPAYFGRFVLRRMLRLDPPYWVAIALAIGATATIRRFAGDDRRPPSIGEVAAHVAYLQAWLDIPHFNQVFWTLCVEVQFYLAFALLLAASRRMGLSIGALSLPLLGVSLWTIRYGEFPHWRDVQVSLLPNYALFYLGSTACTAYLGRGGGWFVLGALACIVRLGVEWNEHLAAGLATVLAIWLAGRFGGMETRLSGRAVQFLGTISYSLYLVHGPVERLTTLAIYRFARPDVLTGMVAMLASIVASVGAAYVFFRLVERPSLRLSKAVAR